MRFVNCIKWRRRKLVNTMILIYPGITAAKRSNEILGYLTSSRYSEGVIRLSYKVAFVFNSLLIIIIVNVSRKGLLG